MNERAVCGHSSNLLFIKGNDGVLSVEQPITARGDDMGKAVFNIVILGGALVVLTWVVQIYYQPIFN